MRLTSRPTQFSTGPSSRSMATPTCSSCCCCCCCIATIGATPIINGIVGAQLAAKNGRRIGPAKIAATLAGFVPLATAIPLSIIAGILIAAMSESNLPAWITLNPVAVAFILVCTATYLSLYATTKRSGSSTQTAIFWTLILLFGFGLSFVIEVAVAIFIIFQLDWSLYLLLSIGIIFGAIGVRWSAVSSIAQKAKVSAEASPAPPTVLDAQSPLPPQTWQPQKWQPPSSSPEPPTSSPEQNNDETN